MAWAAAFVTTAGSAQKECISGTTLDMTTRSAEETGFFIITNSNELTAENVGGGFSSNFRPGQSELLPRIAGCLIFAEIHACQHPLLVAALLARPIHSGGV